MTRWATNTNTIRWLEELLDNTQHSDFLGGQRTSVPKGFEGFINDKAIQELTYLKKTCTMHPEGLDKQRILDMLRFADYLGCSKLMSLLDNRTHIPGLTACDAWFQLALYMAWPEMHEARQKELGSRSCPELLTDPNWFANHLVDLSELAPSSALLGSDRASKILRARPLHRGAARWKLPDLRHDHCPPLRYAEEPVLFPTTEWTSRLQPDIVKVLTSLPYRGPIHCTDGDGYVTLAGGGPLHAVYQYSPPPSDYDLFVCVPGNHGDNAIASAQKILETVLDLLDPDLVTATDHAVTATLRSGTKVQVVLRVYGNPAHCILGFDIQSCKVAMWGLPSGEIAAAASPTAVCSLAMGAILVDPERRSENYADRIKKYIGKGFVAIAPLLCLGIVDVQQLTSCNGGFASIVRVLYGLERSGDGHMRVKAPSTWQCDYDTGIVRLYIWKRECGKHISCMLPTLNRIVLGTSRKPVTSRLNWIVHDVMRQGPVSGCFHPTLDSMYNLYNQRYTLDWLLTNS